MTILVASTLAAYVMDQEDTWSAWLSNAETLRASVDEPVEFFAAIETDARGLAPFMPLCDWLEALSGFDAWWTFDVDDGRTEITTSNRLRHITAGQNLCSDRATSDLDVTHMLFLAADCRPPDDVLPELLAMGHPYVGPTCPTYCLTGESGWWLPPASWMKYQPPDPRARPVERVMPSAACVLIARAVFTRLRWRWEPVPDPTRPGEIMSDDPCYYADALELLGVEGLTRTDLIARHFPEHVPPIEDRGHDRTVVR